MKEYITGVPARDGKKLAWGSITKSEGGICAFSSSAALCFRPTTSIDSFDSSQVAGTTSRDNGSAPVLGLNVDFGGFELLRGGWRWGGPFEVVEFMVLVGSRLGCSCSFFW